MSVDTKSGNFTLRRQFPEFYEKTRFDSILRKTWKSLRNAEKHQGSDQNNFNKRGYFCIGRRIKKDPELIVSEKIWTVCDTIQLTLKC